MLLPRTIARRTALALGTILFLVPGPLSGQVGIRISGPFRDLESGELSIDYLREAIPLTYRAAGLELPQGALEEIIQVYAQQPGVEIVMFDHQTGRAMPGQLTGRASFTIGDDIDGRRACGSPCSQLGSGRTLKLDAIGASVTMPGIGEVSVRRSRDSRTIGFVNPSTGLAFVQWPVSFTVPENRVLGSGFTTDAVFKGYGQLSGDGGLMVIDVARVVANGRVMDTTNINCIRDCAVPNIPGMR